MGFMVRIGIREQLAGIVLICCLVCLAVISIATWETSYSFTTSVSSSNLQLTAFLYSQQLYSNLFLIENTVQAISSRVLVQNALLRYMQGNNTAANWSNSHNDLNDALSIGGSSSFLFQARVVGNNATGLGGPYGLINVTSSSAPSVALPAKHANGTQVFLGDEDQGYPESLYPMLDYGNRSISPNMSIATASYKGQEINSTNLLFLGPWMLNASFGLCSITLPVVNNTSRLDTLGWETIVFSAMPIYDIAISTQGIGDTGTVLIIGPDTYNNLFPSHTLFNDPPVRSNADSQQMHFVIPPPFIDAARSDRHEAAMFPTNATFALGQYPAASQVVTLSNSGLNNGGSFLDTTNEEGASVSVGFALLPSTLVNWIVLVEQTYAEVQEPVVRLRNVIIACLFGTLGVVLLFLIPVAHYSVGPIHRLRIATLKSVDPYAYPSENSDDGASSVRTSISESPSDLEHAHETPVVLDEKKGIVKRILQRLPMPLRGPRRRKSPRQGFRIPGKVPDGHHYIHDELTDLTRTFNSMVEELMMQYERLEEKVRERTAELELSKIAAEAANESKTLFIANISHELKTPLNGILGMTALCMHEDDPTKLKRSLGIIYKSGDLLLNLLTDLLTFSKNQIGQQLNLDEKEFRLADISSQVLSIFEKQAREASIKLEVQFEGPNRSVETSSGTPAQLGFGPFGTGRVKDMFLWGDQHRILQVVINLVSNSLKFTPAGGSVTVCIRCVGEYPEEKPPSSRASRKGSTQSRQSKSSRISKNVTSGRTSRLKSRNSSGSESSFVTAEPSDRRPQEVNSRDAKSLPLVHVRERSLSPPPLNARTLLFEFEVEDTGPGIPAAQQQKVFEPFVQGDLGLSKKYGGTGLGLSICSQLASLMRGSIGMHSVEGEGTTFVMRIPLRYMKERADSTASSSLQNSSRNSLLAFDPKSEVQHTPRRSGSDSNLSTHSAPPSAGPVLGTYESPPNKTRLVGLSQPFFTTSPPLDTATEQLDAIERAAAVTQQGGKIRVLVAEDNKVNQEVVLRMLKLEEIYDVTVAKDGQEAFDLVKESMTNGHPYDLIFMDIQMPNLDGLQSTRLIRQMGYSAPIVALTAFAEESNVQECMDSGMDFFLPKPIRRPQLKQVLKRYCPTIPEAEEESPPISKKNSLVAEKSISSSAGASHNVEPPTIPEASVVAEGSKIKAIEN